MEDRLTCLRRLVQFTAPVEETIRDLSAFPWDSDEELVTLTTSHVADVLRRFLRNDLTAKQVEEWAEALEVRDDVHFDEQPNEQVLEAVHFLANPYLVGELTRSWAEEWIGRLHE